MSDGPGADPQVAGGVAGDAGTEAPGAGQAPDARDELRALVGHEPGVKPALRFGPGTAVQHHPVPPALDEEPRRGISG